MLTKACQEIFFVCELEDLKKNMKRPRFYRLQETKFLRVFFISTEENKWKIREDW